MAQPQVQRWQALAVRAQILPTSSEAWRRTFVSPRELAIIPVGQNGQRERRNRPPVHPPAFVLRHRLDSRLVEACILRRLRHLRRFLEFGRGLPASSSTSLPPWTLGSHSFEDGACRTTRRWRVVLAPKLAVRGVFGTACSAWEQ